MVCFTSLTEEEKEKAASIGVKPYSWDEFLHMVGLLGICRYILLSFQNSQATSVSASRH